MYPSISHGQERYTSGNKLDGVCLSKMDEIYILCLAKQLPNLEDSVARPMYWKRPCAEFSSLS